MIDAQHGPASSLLKVTGMGRAKEPLLILGLPPNFSLVCPISPGIAGFWLKLAPICNLRVHIEWQRMLWAYLRSMKLSRRSEGCGGTASGWDCIQSLEHSIFVGAIASRRSICVLAADFGPCRSNIRWLWLNSSGRLQLV